MKKHFILLVLSILTISVEAQQIIKNNYEIESESRQNDIETIKSPIGSVTISYYDFDGYENWGLGGYLLRPDGFGFEWFYRSNSDRGGNSNVDIGINYSFSLVEKEDTQFLFSLGLAPSLRMQKEYDIEEGDWSDKDSFFFDGCANLKFVFRYKRVVLSAGYNLWGPKFKFGKDYRIDGFNVAIGLAI